MLARLWFVRVPRLSGARCRGLSSRSRSGDEISVLEEFEVEFVEEARLERDVVVKKDVSPTDPATQESAEKRKEIVPITQPNSNLPNTH